VYMKLLSSMCFMDFSILSLLWYVITECSSLLL
jgi:hypothetical protein